MNEIKLKVSVDGADAAKKAVEDVNDAVNKSADAEKQASAARVAAAIQARKAAQAAAEEARRAREAVGAVDAQIAAEKKLAVAKVEAAAAAARRAKEEEAERTTAAALEKQAERTAKAVERMAISRGKSPEVAEEMAGFAKGRVIEGASPSKVLWGVRSGLSAESQALKEIAAASGPAVSGLDKVGGSVASTATKTQGLVSAGRLLANAFLPDMWVARTLSAGRALIAVLSGLSAASLGVVGVMAGALAGAFYKFWQAQKDNREAGEKLNATLKAQAEAAEAAADRHDMLRKDLGTDSLENAAKSYYALSKESEDYANSLRRVNDELAANLEAETARIALTESVDLAKVRKQFAPDIAAARREAAAARRAETSVGVEYDAKIRAAKTPEERAALAAQRDEAKARERERAEVAQERRRTLEADQSDALAAVRAKAILDKAKAEADHAAKVAPVAKEDALRARAGLTRDEADATKLQGTRDEYLNRLKALPGMQVAGRAAILTAKDKTARDQAIATQVELLKKTQEEKVAPLDKEIAGMEESWLPLTPKRRLDLDKLRAKRSEFGDPAKTIALLGDYGKAADLTEQADSTLRTTRKEVIELERAAARAAEKAEAAKVALDVAKANADVDTQERATSASERTAAAADASAIRASQAENRKALNAAGDALGRRAHASIAVNSAEDFGLTGKNADDFESLRPDLAKADRALTDGETNRADIARFADVLQRLLAVSEQSHEQGKTLRAAIDPLQSRLSNLESQVRAAR